MLYRKVDTNLDFVNREKEVTAFWTKNNIAQKAIDNRSNCKQYTFYDGPPTANGQPHIGHVFTRVIKDLFPRYHSMKGQKVLRKAGWDTHGLPVELEVEKMIGISGKEQIETYGVEPFIKKCRESVWKYKTMWEKFSDMVGFWADMNNPYITYENNYIESEWWALKQIWNKHLLYKGHKVVPYCPRCGTPLSSHEVALGYKNIKDRSAIIKFKATNEDVYFLAWTTTPWTLPSNVCLCVNPNIDYVKIRVGDTKYILAQALVNKVFSDIEEEPHMIATYKGKELEYTSYEPLYSFAEEIIKNSGKRAYYVICDNYVTTEDGTGIVHCAPAFGEDDNRVCCKYDIPLVQLVDNKGNMTHDTDWPGVFVRDANPLILSDLEKSGKLFKVLLFEHNYPHCWRCDTPLIYYARESWFIKMSAVKDKLLENNAKINWIPSTIGTGRFGSWLEHVQDWSISRNRYWGTPLNIWECNCGHKHAIGSIAELKQLSSNCPDDIELHRPYIDAVTFPCPKCGEEMHRVPEVIDCWFDSGAMPFAQWHYPFENKKIFEEHFPADFISEAVDQTRGWFYSLMAIATLIFNDAPFKNCIVLGLVLDKDGQKMSKSKGNAVSPMAILNKYGADAIRWYFYENSAPWLPNRFHDSIVTEGQRKFLGTLWNTYAFFVLYANIDNFDATKYTIDYSKLSVMDRWILSRLNTMIKIVDNALMNYEVPESARALYDFIDELSNWYIRRNRSRFWASGMEQDKINAYMTLYTVLVTFAKAAAPMIPFITENIYRNLVCSVDKSALESVHLCDYPVTNEQFIDIQLENDMNAVLQIVALGRTARNAANIKNRQPIADMFIKAAKPLSQFFVEIIKDELNIKHIEFCDNMNKFIRYSAKPNYRVLGKKVSNRINEIKLQLEHMDGAAIKAQLDIVGKFELNDLTLTAEDIEITMIPVNGYNCQSNNSFSVALSTALTPELIEEGYIRELISKIQMMRREHHFDVTDHIKIFISSNDKLAKTIINYIDTIISVTLADEIIFNKHTDAKTWNINGEKVELAIEKI